MAYRDGRTAYEMLDVEKFAIPSRIKTGMKVGAGIGGASLAAGGVTQLLANRKTRKREQLHQAAIGHMAGQRMALLQAMEAKKAERGFPAPDGEDEDEED